MGLAGHGADRIEPSAAARPPAARLWAAGGWAAFAGGAFALVAGVVLWASEGARVFVEAGFSAMLACL
ncbi:hypothetical protein [Chenggangzhangella methanolivorans]|uniref:Uncharacterized protein n=1 Tax=Chenggangzhangella methanolivorans TaxID=1437009 RepID=A0A9E6R6H0_9HYPH|nr:hypothetical protein [Chenggangzhangella methanolivorans]QZN99140.1 hypothetical protein K6K41_20195 [Chenggangzhangella methanolivorans]